MKRIYLLYCCLLIFLVGCTSTGDTCQDAQCFIDAVEKCDEVTLSVDYALELVSVEVSGQNHYMISPTTNDEECSLKVKIEDNNVEFNTELTPEVREEIQKVAEETIGLESTCTIPKKELIEIFETWDNSAQTLDFTEYGCVLGTSIDSTDNDEPMEESGECNFSSDCADGLTCKFDICTDEEEYYAQLDALDQCEDWGDESCITKTCDGCSSNTYDCRLQIHSDDEWLVCAQCVRDSNCLDGYRCDMWECVLDE